MALSPSTSLKMDMSVMSRTLMHAMIWFEFPVLLLRDRCSRDSRKALTRLHRIAGQAHAGHGDATTRFRARTFARTSGGIPTYRVTLFVAQAALHRVVAMAEHTLDSQARLLCCYIFERRD